ncbi:MAG: V-type ATP synthase subunit E family protein [Gammaproteobacteria bacterium]|nr:V-type ATP synthase subunit E family protein [Gammaproteobacteria bacterium]
MKAEDQVAALEQAIRERAEALAAEHLEQAERARERIRKETSNRIQLLEEKENLSAQAQGEREYRRRVQASELRLQAELDRLRWGLVEHVLFRVTERLHELRDDEEKYTALFKQLLAQAAACFEQNQLEALVSETDHRRFAGEWEALVADCVTDKEIHLANEHCPCNGGVLVRTVDGRIGVNNTFEGRMERMKEDLQRLALERLFSHATNSGALLNG